MHAASQLKPGGIGTFHQKDKHWVLYKPRSVYLYAMNFTLENNSIPFLSISG